ncbi:MAG: Protein-L-isoaspartate O-methyltransferase [candidate division Kazan bacterium GW2011_GWC1_52_13]|nr:MAG: Protein-L-isoaspartate O-methyltransferase [candidate division Kazan bacterium GW2011_GWC1_52_13]
MFDLAQAKEEMLKEHLQARGIEDERVLSAFREVPREEFIPQELNHLSYEDTPLEIGNGQTISQPYTVAFMTQLLGPKEKDVVLEVGTGSGYQGAILSRLVRQVYSIERFKELSDKAKEVLDRLGYKNVELKVGDGSLGWPEKAPFNGVIVTAGSPDIPPPLLEQLKEDGRLVIPVGTHGQEMMKVTKTKVGVKREVFPGFRFVPLVGEAGFKG